MAILHLLSGTVAFSFVFSLLNVLIIFYKMEQMNDVVLSAMEKTIEEVREEQLVRTNEENFNITSSIYTIS